MSDNYTIWGIHLCDTGHPLEKVKDTLRKTAWRRYIYTFGNAYIFDTRAQKYAKFVNLLKVFGIVIPVFVGATAMGYGFNSSFLKSAIWLATPLTITQLIFSVLAVVFMWDQELAYAYDASQDYRSLAGCYEKLGQVPPNEVADFKKELDILEVRYQSRSGQDAKHCVAEWEKRRGLRYALRQLQKECVGCKKTPLSMESTDCPVCGHFKKQWYGRYPR